jgi:histidinol-phosphatase
MPTGWSPRPAPPSAADPMPDDDPIGLAAELEFALAQADAADAVSLPYFTDRSFHLDWKANHTEVSEADRETETAISSRVLAERPLHGLFGEEHGLVGDASSAWRWIIDPIDGTSNYVRGVPIWATLIALVHDGEPVVGVVSAPALGGRRWWAARGLGAFADGRRCRVSTVAALDEAQVSVTYSPGWDEVGRSTQLFQLQQQSFRARGYGDFWQHMLVAEGAFDIAIDPIVSLWDVAALMPIVEEAGGRCTTLSGVRDPDGGSLVCTNARLHDEVLATFL